MQLHATSKIKPYATSNNNENPKTLIEKLLDHEILSADQEIELAKKVQEWTRICDKVDALIEERKVMTTMHQQKDLNNSNSTTRQQLIQSNSQQQRTSNNSNFSYNEQETGNIKSSDNKKTSGHGTQLVKDAKRRYNLETNLENERQLTEEDVVQVLKIKGGKKEMRAKWQIAVQARQELLRCNFRLVYSIANKLSNLRNVSNPKFGVSSAGESIIAPSQVDELLQEGVVGLSRAIDKYDPEKGIRFSTYATYWIQSYIKFYLRREKTGAMRVPENVLALYYKFTTTVKEYSDSGEKIPSIEQIANDLKVTVPKLMSAITAAKPALSLDQLISDTKVDDNRSLVDIIPDSAPRPEHYVDLSILRQALENALAMELSPHERDVLRLRLGLDDGSKKTIKEIARICGNNISYHDVLAVERNAYRKLRSPSTLNRHNLDVFLELSEELNDVM